MDMMSLVSSLMAMKSGSTQMQVAATIVKTNADAERSAVQTLLGTPPADPGPGVGGQLDVTA